MHELAGGYVDVGNDQVCVSQLGCNSQLFQMRICYSIWLLLLLFAMIRSVAKSFKVSDVEVAAARMSNESALTHDLLDTKKNLVRLDAGPGWMS